MAGSFANVLVLRDLAGRERFVLGRRVTQEPGPVAEAAEAALAGG